MRQSWPEPWEQRGANLAQQRSLFVSGLAMSRSLQPMGDPAKAMMFCEL